MLLVKVGYIGWAFRGSQTQPHGETVEDALREGLVEIAAVDDPDEAGFRMASRTDAGVSARANAFRVATAMDPDEMVAALNGVLDDVHPWGWAEVPDGFAVRQARSRRYRYHLFYSGWDARAIQEAADVFEGEHDVAGFSRSDPGRDGDTTRFVDAVDVRFHESFVTIDVRARGFLWEQVRRMVAALEAVGRGELTREDLEAVLETGRDLGLEPAPPEPLVLVDIDYGLDVNVVDEARERVRQEVFASAARHLTRARVLKDLTR